MSTLRAQDFHYSMYQLSPLNLNPALTGHHNGDLRVNTNHRTQWSTVSVPFNTYSISSDLSKLKSIPFGILINQDIAGDSRFSTLQVNISSAFNLINDTLQQLRIGFQSGITSRSISATDLAFNAQYNGIAYDPNLSNNENFNTYSRLYGNVNLGCLYSRKINAKQLIKAQFGVFNLNRSNQSFLGAAPPVTLDVKFNGSIDHQYKFNDFFQINSSIYYISQGPHKEILFGSELKYTLAELAYLKRAVWTGVYYRNKDALFISSGIIFDAWKIGLSYDVNLSELVPASRRRGGFEIAIAYLLKRKIKLDSPILICPDFI